MGLPVSALLNHWRGHLPISLSGLTPSAAAFVCAKFLCSGDENTKSIILLPTPDQASTFHQDLRNFLQLMGQPEIASSVDIFPGWEHSPYGSIQPSIKNRI